MTSRLKLAALFFINAAAMGQKAISALTASPGINCWSVMLPASQNGMESAKTSRKNFSGDRIGGTPSPAGAASYFTLCREPDALIVARRTHRA